MASRVHSIPVHLGDRSYRIAVGPGLLATCGERLHRMDSADHYFIITNKKVFSLWGTALKKSLKAAHCSHEVITVVDSERAKSIKVCVDVLSTIAAQSKGKRVGIIAFGGGVIGDLAGLVAALYKRGIPYIQIPTTLLAQVDSSIGGKVAVDLPVAKNLIGAFYQPKLVLSDSELLTTLPPRQIRAGLGEIIKYGMIADKALFEQCEQKSRQLLQADPLTLAPVITQCSRIKAAVVAADEFDVKGKRMHLNFGHTIGHAIETASLYSRAYLHGEAVALGMLSAVAIAESLGMCAPSVGQRLEALTKAVGLPVKIHSVALDAILAAYGYDKKFLGKKSRLILPRAIGKTVIKTDIPIRLAKKAIADRLT